MEKGAFAAKFLKFVNFLVFTSLIVTGSYMLIVGDVQVAFDLYVLASLYIMFTKLEKYDKVLEELICQNAQIAESHPIQSSTKIKK